MDGDQLKWWPKKPTRREAIARPRSVGKETILVNVPEEKTNAGLKVMNEAGYNVSVTVGDGTSREAIRW